MRRIRVLSSLVALGALASPPVASAAVIEMGASEPRPVASCPDNCQAVGRVTGYQAGQAGRRSPFRARRRGKIVAFSLQLGRPRADQVDYFNDLFGGPPQARLSVLRPGVKRRNLLTGQSDLFELQPFFGSTPTFALARPLTVKKDYLVALTVPTWAPAFGVGLANEEAWRSSRDAQRCDDVKQAAAQQRRGSLRTYGCLYRTARLLYTVSFVPDPQPVAAEPAPRRATPAPAPVTTTQRP